MTRFDTLVAVVTGGSSGIGAAIADRLIREGAEVVVLDLVPGEGRATFVKADVSSDSSARSAIDSVIESHGRIDLVVNNAGIGAVGTIADNDDEERMRVFDVNVVSVARLSRAALPHLRRSPSAAIVNVASIAATAGLPQRALYSASKGAVVALTRAMAADHLADGIRVNCVAPGTADTPWVDRLLARSDDPAEERRALESRQPHGRLVSAAEIAEAVCYLLSPSALSTTGVTLAVDGGMQNVRQGARRGD